MKKFILVLSVVLTAQYGTAQSYTPTDNGSSVKFSIKNFGFGVDGSFTGLRGKIIFDPNNLPVASFKVSVSANTVKTGNGSRDSHLKKEEYFNAAAFPELVFTSTKVTAGANAGSFLMEANITIKGTTRKISFPFRATPASNGYKFEGEFKLNRRDFKVGGSSMVLSENLTVNLSIFSKNN